MFRSLWRSAQQLLKRPLFVLAKLCLISGLILPGHAEEPSLPTPGKPRSPQELQTEIFQVADESFSLMEYWINQHIADPRLRTAYLELLNTTPIQIAPSLPGDSLAIKKTLPGHPTSIMVDFSLYQKFPNPQGLEFVLLHEYAHLLHSPILDIRDFTLRKIGTFIDGTLKQLLLKTSPDG